MRRPSSRRASAAAWTRGSLGPRAARARAAVARRRRSSRSRSQASATPRYSSLACVPGVGLAHVIVTRCAGSNWRRAAVGRPGCCPRRPRAARTKHVARRTSVTAKVERASAGRGDGLGEHLACRRSEQRGPLLRPARRRHERSSVQRRRRRSRRAAPDPERCAVMRRRQRERQLVRWCAGRSSSGALDETATRVEPGAATPPPRRQRSPAPHRDVAGVRRAAPRPGRADAAVLEQHRDGWPPSQLAAGEREPVAQPGSRLPGRHGRIGEGRERRVEVGLRDDAGVVLAAVSTGSGVVAAGRCR